MTRAPIASILPPKPDTNTVAVLSVLLHDGTTIDIGLSRGDALALADGLVDKLVIDDHRS